MSQRVQCVKDNREWHADCMQIKMQIIALILHGLLRHSMEGMMAHSHKLSSCQPKDVPHALQPSHGETGGRSLAGRRRVAGKAEPVVSWDYLFSSGAK